LNVLLVSARIWGGSSGNPKEKDRLKNGNSMNCEMADQEKKKKGPTQSRGEERGSVS